MNKVTDGTATHSLQLSKFYRLLADYFTQGYPWRCFLSSQIILIQLPI